MHGLRGLCTLRRLKGRSSDCRFRISECLPRRSPDVRRERSRAECGACGTPECEIRSADCEVKETFAEAGNRQQATGSRQQAIGNRLWAMGFLLRQRLRRTRRWASYGVRSAKSEVRNGVCWTEHVAIKKVSGVALISVICVIRGLHSVALSEICETNPIF